MARLFSILVPVLLLSALAGAQTSSPSAANPADRFILSGMVVNAVTGEPIPRALVQAQGASQRSAFSGSDGHFQLENMLPGTIYLSARKPGYFDDPHNKASLSRSVVVGPSTGPVSLALTPYGAIYGRVIDPTGQPVEHLPIRLTTRTVREGRKHWDSNGMAESDEDGRFRFGNLMPGAYYLSAGPGRDDVRIAPPGAKVKTGYASVYYPGVPDLASASPMVIAAGQQAEADLPIAPVPVYSISGIIAGYSEDQGVGVQVFSQSGDDIAATTRVDMENGKFEVESVPAGTYLLKAFAQAGPGQALRAEIRLNVNSNLNNVHLVLSPAVNMPVIVRLDSSTSSQTTQAWKMGPPPLTVHLVAVEPPASDSFATMVRGNDRNFNIELQNVDPGTYAAEITPRGPWYVYSAQYGQTNVLAEHLVVTPGQAYSLEVTLRDDAATVTGTIRSADAGQTNVTIVALPTAAGRAVPRAVVASPQNGFTMSNLVPGEYLLFALDRADGVEYANPDTLQSYASQAAHVTLAPNQKTQVVLDLIHTGDAR